MTRRITRQNFFSQLEEWAAASPERKRHTEVVTGTSKRPHIEWVVRLTWIDRHGGVCALSKTANTPEEAAEEVLAEFDKCNFLWDHN